MENGNRIHHAEITVTGPDMPTVGAESIPRATVRGANTSFSLQAADPSGWPLMSRTG